MMKRMSSRKELLSEGMKIAVLTISGGGLVVAACVWLYLSARGLHFVRKANYCVSVSGKPRVRGHVYSLGGADYLLVLMDGPSKRYEAYYMNLDLREVGLPSFDRSKYMPLRRGALLDKRVLEKYPQLGTLMADWQVSQSDIRMRIIGFPPEVERSDPVPDPGAASLRMMPLAYNTEVILAKK